MDKDTRSRLWRKYQDHLCGRIEEIINQGDTISLVFNAFNCRGRYGSSKWYEAGCLPRGLKTLTLAIADIHDERVADRFVGNVIEYTSKTLPTLDQSDRRSISKYADEVHTSNCVRGWSETREAHRILYDKGYYDELDKVYSTLVILDSYGLADYVPTNIKDDLVARNITGANQKAGSHAKALKESLFEKLTSNYPGIERAELEKLNLEDIGGWFTEKNISPREYLELVKDYFWYKALSDNLIESDRLATLILDGVDTKRLRSLNFLDYT
ncbi:MAG: hypothetical protein AABX47_06625 [Nanoarchaeota archaeon]|mgnify:CR=1 FL=1